MKKKVKEDILILPFESFLLQTFWSYDAFESLESNAPENLQPVWN